MLVLFLPLFSVAQEGSAEELNFEVNKVYPYLELTKEKLQDAQTLVDLNPYFKPTWVNTYLSVEVMTTQQGKARKATGKSDVLNAKQKDLLLNADIGTEIAVYIQYLPENTLSHNEPKVIEFAFTPGPEEEASFAGGPEGLQEYLKEKAINNISDDIFTGYTLAVVKFTVNEEGEILAPRLVESSKDEATDQLLVDAIRQMPCWQPAAYSNGLKVKQEYILLVGSMENCNIHVLNIRRGD